MTLSCPPVAMTSSDIHVRQEISFEWPKSKELLIISQVFLFKILRLVSPLKINYSPSVVQTKSNENSLKGV